MATRDERRGIVTLRLVFDGLPRSGKTTTVRSLSAALKRPVVSPGEIEGRTLLFDWMDYTGGRFEGYQICCQVVSVPGQAGLLSRRRHLLETADAVVFVLDSAGPTLAPALEEAARVRDDLRKWAASSGEPAVGLILQANKRDAEGALPIRELRTAIQRELPGVAIVESSARDGLGVRETFVFAVRVALDRVRELMAQGKLAEGPPSIATPEELRAQVEVSAARPDSQSFTPPGAISENDAFAPPESTVEDGVPATEWRGARPPDDSVPSGMVWPPIEGRLYLHEAMAEGGRPHADADGLAIETHTGWIARSPSTGVFREPEEGRRALIEWARAHRSLSSALSSSRCLVLADAGDGTLRLWQVVRREPTLRDRLNLAFEKAPELLADALLDVARMVLAAPRLAQAGRQDRVVVPARIEDVGVEDGQPVVIGPAPHPLEARVVPAPPRRPYERFEEAFGPFVRAGLRVRIPDTPAVIDRILERCSGRPDLGETASALAMVLLGEAPAPLR